MKPKIFALALIFYLALNGRAIAFNFTDVWPGSYCFEALVWAAENGVANGTGNGAFEPNRPCTQGQFLLFLWRANGSPEPLIANPFNNTINAAYYKPALWGYQQGMVSGYSFNPNAECNLGMVLTSLWLSAGRPAPDTLTWAVENGLNKGSGINTFSSEHICSRGQVLVLLYNLHNWYGGDDRSAERDDNRDYREELYDEDDDWDNDNSSNERRDLRVDAAGMSKAASIVGNSYSIEFSLSVAASGGSGGYEYWFELIQNGEVTSTSDSWGVENAIRTRVSGVGSCEMRVTVRDSAGTTASTVVDLLERSSSGSGRASISSGSFGSSSSSSVGFGVGVDANGNYIVIGSRGGR